MGVRESTYVSCPIFPPPCSWSWITDAKALCRRCMGCLYFVSDLPLHLREDILIRREPKFLSSARKAPLVKWLQFSMGGITVAKMWGRALLEDTISQSQDSLGIKRKTNNVTKHLKTSILDILHCRDTHNKVYITIGILERFASFDPPNGTKRWADQKVLLSFYWWNTKAQRNCYTPAHVVEDGTTEVLCILNPCLSL